MQEVDANKVIQTLASKIVALEAENAILKTQLNEQESGEDDGKQDTQPGSMDGAGAVSK